MLASALHKGKGLLAPCGRPPLPLPAFPQTTSILTRPEQPPWRPDCLLPILHFTGSIFELIPWGQTMVYNREKRSRGLRGLQDPQT